MKNHLKRIAAPKTWIINRKENKFTVRPKPGAHSLGMGLPLGNIIKNLLKLSSSTSETKKLLNNKNILVDGKRRKDHRFIVGLFDILSIPELKKNYCVLLDKKGRIIVTDINNAKHDIKLCKIVGKTILSKGKIQFNLHDGKNIVVESEAKVGDTFVMGLPKLEVKETLPLKVGSAVFLIKGKHGGDVGKLKEVRNEEAIYISDADGKEIETAKEYIFVIKDKDKDKNKDKDKDKNKENDN